ncbi:MAG: hypothetical protein EOO62_27115, partial [Hymenobacter sp.]
MSRQTKTTPVGRWHKYLVCWVIVCCLGGGLATAVAAQPLRVSAAPADTLAPVSEALVRHYLARSLSVPALSVATLPMARRRPLLY